MDGDSRPSTPVQGLVPEPPPPEPQPVIPPPIEPAFQDQVDDPPCGVALEQTTLLQNEEESFALAPVDASALRGENSLTECIWLPRQCMSNGVCEQWLCS